MPSNTYQEHYSQVLTDVAVKFVPPDLRAKELIRPHAVVHENDVFPVYDKSGFDQVDDVRADGDPSHETDMGWTYTAYQCEDHALKTKVTKRQMDNSDDPEDLKAQKTENIKQKVLNNLEVRVFGTGGFARTAGNVINSRNFDWSTAATAQVRRDIDLLKEDVETASGVTPNVIALTPAVARAIMRTAEWRDEAKYTNDLRSDNDIPAQMYGLRVVPITALINSAKKGQATSLGRLMGEDVLVAYVNPSEELPKQALTWAANLYTEEYGAEWWDDDRRCWMIEYGYIYTLKLIARECAALGTSVLTA